MFAVEAILFDSEGEIITVEFLAHDSKRLAEEYASWKNHSQPETSTRTSSMHV